MTLEPIEIAELSAPKCDKKAAVGYVLANGKLPEECENCCSILLYLSPGKANVGRFESLLESKLGEKTKAPRIPSAQVRCSMEDKDRVYDKYTKSIRDFNVRGEVDWRIACGFLQMFFPWLFKSPKMLSYTNQTLLEQF